VVSRYAVDADIAGASTLPAAFYRDAAAWEATRERVFARSWQWLGDVADVAAPASVSPRTLLPGLLDEPLLLARAVTVDVLGAHDPGVLSASSRARLSAGHSFSES